VLDNRRSAPATGRNGIERYEKRPCRATGIIPAVRLAEEAPRLRALKVQPEQLALRIPVYVGPTGTVLHDGHAYSMPPEAISMPATLYLYVQRVRRAMEEGLKQQIFGAFYVERCLQAGLRWCNESGLSGESMGRASCRSSFLGRRSERFLVATAKTFYFCFSSLAERGLQRPAAVKGARLSGAAGANP
jgi:hypothetical protein